MVGVSSDITEVKRMAEAASEAAQRKDDFLATLAHELRNPLAAVRTGVAVIRKAKGDPDDGRRKLHDHGTAASPSDPPGR